MRSAGPLRDAVHQPLPPHYESLLTSWVRSLRAENASPKTITVYSEAVKQLGGFLVMNELPTTIDAITREHIETYLADVLEKRAPATAANRYRALRRYFGWLVEEGELTSSPMERIKAPRVPETPPDVLTEEQLKQLLKACDGRDFDDRRDMAIVRLFIDSGCRVSEIAGLNVDDLDLDLDVIRVVGKGRRPRAVPFGKKAARDLDRYLRARAGHKDAETPALWLGPRGGLTPSGVYQVVEKRAKVAGIEGVHPHLFRHTFAHSWLSAEGGETDLMMLTGWKSRSMLQRYGASKASQRAREAHRRLSPGDRL